MLKSPRVAVGLMMLVGLAAGNAGVAQMVTRDVSVAGPATQPDKPNSPMEKLAGDPTATQPDSGMSPMPAWTQRPTTQPTTAPDTTANIPMPDRAFARLKLGKYDLAEKDLQEVLKTDATKLSGSVGLAELYRRTGRYDEAAKTLDAVAAAGEKSVAWRCEKAELLATLGKYEEALKLSQAALNDDQNSLRARFITGQLLEATGRIDEAKDVYKPADEMTSKKPPEDAAERTYAGLVLNRYSRLISKPVSYGTRILQDLYQDAYEKIDRQYWPARVAAGDLSLAAYKTQQAGADYQAALKINPKGYEANLGLGRALLEMYRFEDVEKQIDACKKVNAKDPAVIELEAALRMMERNWKAAAEKAQAGLAINPNHLGLMGTLAAAKLRVGDKNTIVELTKRAEAVNPKPAEFFSTVADWQSAARQFDDAEVCFLKAIEQAPWDPNPMTSLGMMYMQTGQEDKASKILDRAFAIDRYNARSKNTLDLLDQLLAFDSIVSEHFIVKFNRTTDGILGPYFRDYLESIYAELSRDYDIQLPKKTTVEVFPQHDQFSVRTTGRPWIPTVGACTGWVIAMYSPRDMVSRKNPQTGEPMGFNWSRVLRHEFTHVVTLAATENRIPHWFTEGLAVTQEHNPPQWKWIQMLSNALRQDQLFKVSELDWGFIRPRRPTDREMAYAQSEWMTAFIVEQYGYPKINELLKAYRNYRTQPEAFKEVLNTTESDFDKAFRVWAREQVVNEWRMPADRIVPLPEAEKAAKTQPDDVKAKVNLAIAQYYARKPKEAEQTARDVLKRDPQNSKALEMLGAMLEKDKWPEAKEMLLKLAEIDDKVAIAPRLLAKHALQEDQRDLAIFWFKRLKLANPHDPISYTGLAGIYLDMKASENAIPELAELAKRQQSDPVYALKLAELYTQLDKPDQALIWLDEAIHFDPFNAATHERLAKAYLSSKQFDKAVDEMKIAIQLKPDESSYWARLAYIYDGQGKAQLARKAAEFAVKLNPESSARDLIQKLSPHSQPQGGASIQ
ncbi:MAG: tetratricopeptide repeat protein [Phycisphaerae bacterium]|nr:tetratricopeptide repeat protein [Phycisphaerae bacterium]